MNQTPEAVPPRPNVSGAVLTAVVESYYPEVVRAGTSARARAQAAQSVATVFATGLVASLTLTDLRNQYPLLRITGCLAVLAWSIAALLYVRAVGRQAPLDERVKGVEGDDQLVRTVLDRARVERDIVERRQRIANAFSAGALLLTAATFAGAALLPGYEEEKSAILLPSQEQRDVLTGQCNLSGSTLRGSVQIASLRADTIDFVLRCQGKKFHLQVPKKDLKGLIILDK